MSFESAKVNNFSIQCPLYFFVLLPRDMKKKFNLKERYHAFKAWQMRPREVAANSQEEHECMNCHDSYTGNFCPRCGQSAATDRYSMKVAAVSFADAYGMGERGMFRTIRDLILRPGYLILDYLRGMRASYFAPFKLFFLLTAISLLVTHGVNIKGQSPSDEDETTSAVQEVKEERTAEETATIAEEISTAGDIDLTEEEIQLGERVKTIFSDAVDGIARFQERFSSIFMLLMLMFLSGYLFLFFRHSPNIPDLRYAEFFIALLYITNMYTIYTIVFDFFCLNKLSVLSIFLTLIPLKQMSGYSWWRTTLKTAIASISMFVLLIVLLVLVLIAIGIFVKKFG